MLNALYLLVILASVVVGFLCIKKANHPAYKLMLSFLLLTFCNEFTCYILRVFYNTDTTFSYNIYFYIRGCLLLGAYYQLLKGHKRVNFFFLFAICVVILLIPFNLYFYGGIIKKMHSISYQVIWVLVLFCCMIYFYNFFKNDIIVYPFKQPFFFITASFIIFSLCMLPFFGIYNYLVKYDESVLITHRDFAQSLSIFLYSFIAWDFFLEWKRKKLLY